MCACTPAAQPTTTECSKTPCFVTWALYPLILTSNSGVLWGTYAPSDWEAYGKLVKHFWDDWQGPHTSIQSIMSSPSEA
eukprot:4539113-Pleurochrysis_carterae.AAC.1